jgi:hypothetical protein
MPANACVAFYDCKGCGKTLKPLPGSCCVFCSYGSVPCPPIQQGVEPCCTPLPDKRFKDWLARTRTSLMAWWVPTVLIVAGLFVRTPLRTGIWIAALAWMGVACLLNASRSGRTHCRFTGPYYLLMIAPTLALGSMDAPLYAWLVLAALVLLGDKIIWWATELAWGTFSSPVRREVKRLTLFVARRPSPRTICVFPRERRTSLIRSPCLNGATHSRGQGQIAAKSHGRA